MKLDVLDKTLATGVADARGSVPRFGESVIEVPVTASTLRVALGALGMFLNDGRTEKLTYRLEGKLESPGFGSTRFHAQGELPMPVPMKPAIRPEP